MSDTSDPTLALPFRTRHRWRRWVVAGVCSLLMLLPIAHSIALHCVAEAIVAAPNCGQSQDVLRLWEVQHHPDDVSQAVRIEVGPPPASLGVWIMNPSQSRPCATVLVLHGINSSKDAMLGIGRLLAGNDFRAVLVDLRGHGQSTGERLTFGVRESADLSQVIDWLAVHDLLAGEIGIYGPSYGGATAILAAGRDARIKAVVTVSTFRAMRAVVPGYVRHYLPLGQLLPDWWIERALTQAGVIAGFDINESDPLHAIQATAAHVLLIHGSADVNIPVDHSRAMHDACPERTRLIVLENEDHASIMQDRTGQLSTATVQWFRRWLMPAASSQPAAVVSEPAGQ